MADKIACVYKISFNGTDKFYIGSTVDFIKRKQNHKRDLVTKKHCNQIMQRIYNKHGEPLFDILEEIKRWDCPVFKVILLDKEQHYIDTLNPIINICKNAGSSLGRKCSENTKNKSSKTKKDSGVHKGENNWMFGRKGNLSPMFGKEVSKETRIKRSVSTTRSKQRASKLNPKDVREIRDKWESNTITHKQARNKEYTQVSLALEYGVGRSCIQAIVNGRTWKDI